MSFFYSDDPVRDAERHMAEMDKQAEKLPVCCECDNHITDEHYFEINGEPLCEQCLNDNHRKRVEDYIE